MLEFLREVGRGKKGARDLTYEQAVAAAKKIASLEATPVQFGAFFMAERVKGEGVEELLAFTHVLREHVQTGVHSPPALQGLDCVGPYDGRTRSLHVTLPAAWILGSLNVPVLLHGPRQPLPPKLGVTTYQVLKELGLPIPTTAEGQLDFYAKLKKGFAETEAFCPPLRRVRTYREELGVRTLLNTAEKLLNVANNPYLVIGVFHTSALDKTAQLVSRLNYRKALIVKGMDGSEDLTVQRATPAILVDSEGVRSLTLDPQDYHLQPPTGQESLSAPAQADAIRHILHGEEHPWRDTAIWNAAIRLWLCDQVPDLTTGIEKSHTALLSGTALERFNEWRSSSLSGVSS